MKIDKTEENSEKKKIEENSKKTENSRGNT